MCFHTAVFGKGWGQSEILPGACFSLAICSRFQTGSVRSGPWRLLMRSCASCLRKSYFGRPFLGTALTMVFAGLRSDACIIKLYSLETGHQQSSPLVAGNS